MAQHFTQLTKQFFIPASICIICLMIAIAGPTWTEILRYDSVALDNQEIWRILTPHFVHLTWSHLAMNLMGLLLVFFFFANCLSWQHWLGILLISALGISLLIYLLNPEIQRYVGLSGVLHALFMMGGLADIKVRKWEGIVFTFLIVVKVLYEQVFGPLPGSEEAAGGPVLVDAHFYGALIGGLGGVLFLYKESQ